MCMNLESVEGKIAVFLHTLSVKWVAGCRTFFDNQ
jgi:hypothetical protein